MSRASTLSTLPKRDTPVTGVINGQFPCQPDKPPTSNLSITDPDFVCLQMPTLSQVEASVNKTASKRSVDSQPIQKRADGVSSIFRLRSLRKLHHAN
jgi:hypothetical protein